MDTTVNDIPRHGIYLVSYNQIFPAITKLPQTFSENTITQTSNPLGQYLVSQKNVSEFPSSKYTTKKGSLHKITESKKGKDEL